MMVLNVMDSAVNEVVPRAGVEPARGLRTTDFKSHEGGPT